MCGGWKKYEGQTSTGVCACCRDRRLCVGQGTDCSQPRLTYSVWPAAQVTFAGWREKWARLRFVGRTAPEWRLGVHMHAQLQRHHHDGSSTRLYSLPLCNSQCQPSTICCLNMSGSSAPVLLAQWHSPRAQWHSSHTVPDVHTRRKKPRHFLRHSSRRDQ